MSGYKNLLTYKQCEEIHDLTVEFCDPFGPAQGRPERKLKGERWIRSWKLKEQMVGAARSAKQNIVEESGYTENLFKKRLAYRNR